MRYTILAAIFAICLLPPASAGAACDGGFCYHYFDEPVPVVEKPGWVAIFSPGTSLSELRGLIDGLGLSSDEQRQSVIDGWTYWHFPDAGTVTQIINTLLDNESLAAEYVAPVFRGASALEVVPAPDILVRIEAGSELSSIDPIVEAACGGGYTAEPFGGMPRAYRVGPGCNSGIALLDAANGIADLPRVEFAEPDMLIGGMARYMPGDPEFSSSWGLNNEGQTGGQPDVDMDAPEAWDITTGRNAVVSVIIDVGVDQAHADINQRTGADFTSDGPGDGGPVNECDNHGTPVAGALSARIDNDEGSVGVAPDTLTASARTFISESTCDGRWSTQFSWTVDALDWAQSIGARITNNSNGYDQPSSSVTSKYRQTHDAGIAHFASAGNDGNSAATYPASIDVVNAVSAVDDRGRLAGFSNRGPDIRFAAPGVAIFMPDRTGTVGYETGDYVVADGTSYAAPMAAGAAALLLSRASNLGSNEIATFLEASATDLGAPGRDDEYGWGLVNANTALLLLEIFSDDLEGGDTSNWSTVVP